MIEAEILKQEASWFVWPPSGKGRPLAPFFRHLAAAAATTAALC